MRAVHLRCDDLNNPIGLGDKEPCFSWHCEGGIKQSAYRLMVKREDTVIWDTGKVLSSSMRYIAYEGEKLHSRDRAMWSVCLWDEKDRQGEWNEAFFEMGLLDSSDWSAEWVTGDYKPKKNIRYPADYFLKKFRLREQVLSARLYITACGFYEAYIDEKRVGNFVLAPGNTDYRCRLQYQTYDVSEILALKDKKDEELSLELLLGDGLYRGSVGCFGKTNVFGRETRLMAQLEVNYRGGGREIIGTDASFLWSNDGPIRRNDFKDGEEFDASMHPTWKGKARVTACKIIPTAADNVPVTEHEEFTGKLLITPSGKRIIDFGQNLAGFLAFTVKGNKGQKIRLTLGEILDGQGEFTQKNMTAQKPVKEFGRMTELLLMTGNETKIRGQMQITPRQQILFTCSGREDHYKTRFALLGFRYALVETDEDFDIKAEDFRAIAVYSDMEQTGSFFCSHPKINQLFSNIQWSMRSNFVDIPMDCPTRERLGWTGDGQIFFHSAAYLYDVSSFYRKWIRDMMDGQYQNGKISAVVPYNGLSMLYDNTGGSVGWADAVVLVPYRFYKRYGDRRVLSGTYEMCRRYAKYMIKHSGPTGRKDYQDIPHRKYVYEKGFHLGEWLEPEEFQDHIAAGNKIRHTEIATAYFHLTMRCMSEIAEILGKQEDHKLWREYAVGAKKAYQELFLQKLPDTNRQSKLARPLAMGLAPKERITERGENESGDRISGDKSRHDSEQTATVTDGQLVRQLCSALDYYHYRVGTGFLSTPFLLDVLSKNGCTEIAYRVLENEQMPGWLYEVNQGATTVWENWEGTASHNHYSPGAVCEWLFETCAGIRADGENHFMIMPVPGGSLTEAKAEYISPYGMVKSAWKKENGMVKFSITVPANTTAKLTLPDGFSKNLCAGDYSFQCRED